MTDELFREDSYLRECAASVVAIDDGALIFDRTVFYPLGGGQPGDTGTLSWDGGSAAIVDTRYGVDGTIRHVLEEGATMPSVGVNASANPEYQNGHCYNFDIHFVDSV